MLTKKRSALDTIFWSSVTPQHFFYRRPVRQILSLIQLGRKHPVSPRAQSRLWSRQLWAVVSFWAGRLGGSSQLSTQLGAKCEQWDNHTPGQAAGQGCDEKSLWGPKSREPPSLSANYPTSLGFMPRKNLKGFQEDRWSLCSAVYSKTASGYSLA